MTLLMGFDLFFTAALTAIDRHQLALAAIKLLVLAQLPLVMIVQTQGFALVLVRQLGFFKGKYVAHQR